MSNIRIVAPILLDCGAALLHPRQARRDAQFDEQPHRQRQKAPILIVFIFLPQPQVDPPPWQAFETSLPTPPSPGQFLN